MANRIKLLNWPEGAPNLYGWVLYVYGLIYLTLAIKHTPFKFSTSVDGKEFTSNVVTFGKAGEKDAFAQITLPYKSPDLHIICENHSGMGIPGQPLLLMLGL